MKNFILSIWGGGNIKFPLLIQSPELPYVNYASDCWLQEYE